MSETLPGANYSKEKARRGYSQLEAIDPHDGNFWKVLLPDKKLAWAAREGKGTALELAYTVRWALCNMCYLFRGVRDDELEIDDDGWLCYVATPPHAYNRRTGAQVPPWPGEVFLVYVTDERVIYHWAWYDCDHQHKNLPIDHAARFTEKVF